MGHAEIRVWPWDPTVIEVIAEGAPPDRRGYESAQLSPAQARAMAAALLAAADAGQPMDGMDIDRR